jgi:murein DD-endopeptidase MepM/ murein hydrolase activator NlpD
VLSNRCRIVVTWLVVVPLLFVAARADADTQDDLEQARAHVAALQREADALAREYEAAQVRVARVEADMTRTRRALEAGKERSRRLRDLVRQRAVEGYVGGNASVVPMVFDDNVLDGRRRLEFLSLANEPTERALGDLRVLDEELRVQQTRLERSHREQAQAAEALGRAGEDLQSKLTQAQAEQSAIERKFQREEAARRRAEAARKRAEEQRAAQARASRASAGSSASPSDGSQSGASQVAEAPVPGASIVCPIQGPLSFVDSWGAPRSGGRRHQGVDLMSPFGTPNVAVVSGNVSMRVGNLSGNSVYLYGDDGNTYYYFHLQSWAGSPRHVSQGEVVGYVGDSGNARGGPSHTHFEYHPGGGGAVNPYPLVRPVC